VMVPRYELSLCQTPIKPDLLGFLEIDFFACGLLNRVFKRFASLKFLNYFWKTLWGKLGTRLFIFNNLLFTNKCTN
jgi:hypothetical protein